MDWINVDWDTVNWGFVGAVAVVSAAVGAGATWLSTMNAAKERGIKEAETFAKNFNCCDHNEMTAEMLQLRTSNERLRNKIKNLKHLAGKPTKP